ncbi:hypothetical protein AmFV_107 [Apis mellifera filamentous virus]|nr:hypothetical protein AmFV_107 [Apis mellifera filamentous virus]
MFFVRSLVDKKQIPTLIFDITKRANNTSHLPHIIIINTLIACSTCGFRSQVFGLHQV